MKKVKKEKHALYKNGMTRLYKYKQPCEIWIYGVNKNPKKQRRKETRTRENHQNQEEFLTSPSLPPQYRWW